MTITFTVPGIPGPGGSKSGFYNKKLDRVLMAPASKKTKPWMKVVSAYAAKAMADGGHSMIDGPVVCTMIFMLPRPKYHFKTRKGKPTQEIKPDYTGVPHMQVPDYGKLARSTEDAMTGIVWRDDSQVVECHIYKHWSFPDGFTGVEVEVKTL